MGSLPWTQLKFRHQKSVVFSSKLADQKCQRLEILSTWQRRVDFVGIESPLGKWQSMSQCYSAVNLQIQKKKNSQTKGNIAIKRKKQRFFSNLIFFAKRIHGGHKKKTCSLSFIHPMADFCPSGYQEVSSGSTGLENGRMATGYRSAWVTFQSSAQGMSRAQCLSKCLGEFKDMMINNKIWKYTELIQEWNVQVFFFDWYL